MSDRIASREALTLVGLGLRTRNAGVGGDAKIDAAWQTYFADKLQSRIGNQLHATATYVAYYDYEADRSAEYSYLVGAVVRNGTDAPDGMVSVVMPASSYVVCEAATAADVPGVWQRIAKSGFARTYAGDFEVHRLNQKIEIYVAVKTPPS